MIPPLTTLLAAVAGLALLAVPGIGAPAAGAATPVIVAHCTPLGGGQGGCGGWFTTAVTLTWQVSNASSADCPPRSFTTDTGGSAESCTATSPDGQTSVTVTVTMKVDRTAPAVVAATPDRGPDANGWYNHLLSVSFSGADATSGIASCTSAAYAGPDSASAAVAGTCTDVAGNVSASASLGLKYDATPPELPSATPGRAPDDNGWYNRPVTVGFAAQDATSGSAGCVAVTYSGPDAPDAGIVGSCEDRAGNRRTRALTIAYDATPPEVVSATPARAAEESGWYTKPLQVAFAGADAVSGVAACSAPTYSGPDAVAAAVSGTCRDRAGNVSPARPFQFKYDGTAPKLGVLTVRKARTHVALSWPRAPGASRYEVVRTPGKAGERQTVLFRGGGAAFRDTAVRPNAGYRYVVRALDDAGNASSRAISVVARPALYRPAAGARLAGPPVLAWEPIAGASYYNVQLWRNGRKVLSSWPARPRFALARTWTFAGRTYRLEPGRYRWYVWPGLGARSKSRFGPLAGSSDFVVRL